MEMRNTIQRSLVLCAVESLDHPTAEEVYTYICAQHPSVSRATIYRNLGVLVDKEELLKVPVTEGADRFDSTLTDHYHVRCRICGMVADVEMPYQHGLINQVTSAGGFVVESHDIMLHGVCPQCAQKKQAHT